MKLKFNKHLITHSIAIVFAIVFCFKVGSSCCLGFGHGLGDVFFIFLLYAICSLYLIIMLITRKNFFKTSTPAFILLIILSYFMLQIIFFRGPECHCELYNSL